MKQLQPIILSAINLFLKIIIVPFSSYTLFFALSCSEPTDTYNQSTDIAAVQDLLSANNLSYLDIDFIIEVDFDPLGISESRVLGINLSELGLTQLIIPESYSHLTALSHFNLEYNNLTNIPTAILNAPITNLNLAWNNLCNFPFSSSPWKEIVKTGSPENQYCNLSLAFFADTLAVRNLLDSNNQAGVSFIRVSTIENGRIVKVSVRDGKGIVPQSFSNLSALKYLLIWDWNLESFPFQILSLTQLEDLYIVGSKIRTLPDSISKLSSLRTLSLSHNLLTSIPAQIGNLANLCTLGLGWDSLSTLPPEIGGLSNLKELDLRANRLSELQIEIWNLDSLTSLALGGNLLTFIPEQITNLIYLDKLAIDGNHITTLPDSIINTNIRLLTVDNNYLCDLPQNIVTWLDNHDYNWKTTQTCDTIIP